MRVTGNGVTLNGITLVNGNTTGNGGAINWSGDTGNVINCNFFNNTAVSGSAIYTSKALNVKDSVFLDNLATATWTYKVLNGGFNVYFVGGDNYINAIHSSASGLSLSNVRYYNGVVTNTNNGILSDNSVGHNVSVEIFNKIADKSLYNLTPKTNSNGNITYSGLAKGYYVVNVKHYTGRDKYNILSFEVPVNVVLTYLELFVPGEIYYGDDITVIAFVNSSVSGNIVFSIGSNSKTGVISKGRASVTFTGLKLNPGSYKIDALYNGVDPFYSQRNSTTFNVKVASNPVVTVQSVNSIIKDYSVIISAITTWSDEIPGVLQLVDLVSIFFHHTIFQTIFC